MIRIVATLAAVAVVAAGCAGLSDDVTPVPTPKPGSINTQMSVDAAAVTLNLVNAYRATLKLEALRLDEQLTGVALQQAQAMADRDTMAHELIGDLASRLKAKGVTNVYAGENLGRNFRTAEAMFGWWVKSPVHAAIMAMKPLTRMGLAVVISPKSNRPYWAMALASGG